MMSSKVTPDKAMGFRGEEIFSSLGFGDKSRLQVLTVCTVRVSIGPQLARLRDVNSKSGFQAGRGS